MSTDTVNWAQELLASITPWPWGTGAHVGEPCALATRPNGSESLLMLDVDGMAICQTAADATFIAAAPTLVSTLVKQLGASQQEVRDEWQRRRGVEADRDSARAERDALKVEVVRLRGFVELFIEDGVGELIRAGEALADDSPYDSYGDACAGDRWTEQARLVLNPPGGDG